MEAIILILILMLLFFILFTILSSVYIVPQASEYIVERLGKYYARSDAGIHFRIPFIDVIVKKVSLKERVSDFAPQPVITKDNVTMQIDTVIYYQITDASFYTYRIENPVSAIENLTATTLRNIIGEMDLDNTLTSRDYINTSMRAILDEATDPWGIKINRVELKNIMPPIDIQQAMEKQMKAEREKRANILQAEGLKQASILSAEGEKEAAILRAEAQKESQIRIAEGQAQAILETNKAKAEALRFIKEVDPNEAVLRVRGMETLERVADGKATKIFMPNELSNVASIATAFGELNKETQSE